MKITGAELLVKALQEEGVDTLFAYPGGQALDLFDALYGATDIEVVLSRHEQGLVHAADGYARATGKVGVCLVTSGPGATNLVTGIATANYDSVPLVCFTGQVSQPLIGHDAFQEVDIVRIVQPITKWAVTVTERDALATVIQQAFAVAVSGKPGAVVVDLPKDIQQALGEDAYTKAPPAPVPRLEDACADQIVSVLQRAKKPLLLLGGGVHIAGAAVAATALAEQLQIPVVTTIMGRGVVPTNHPLYLGNLGIHGSYAVNHAIDACDVLLAIGTRFNDRITGPTETFAPRATLIHIDITSKNIGRNVRADFGAVADAGAAIHALSQRCSKLDTSAWRAQIDTWQNAHPLEKGQQENVSLTPYSIIKTIGEKFQDAFIVTDVGQHQLWTSQFMPITSYRRLITSGGLGAMGYGLPAAIGVQLGCPTVPVIAICGDGGFQMNVQELATAVALELPLIICVLNNGYLGNVRQWQEQFYGKRYSSTCMQRRKQCPIVCNTPSEACPVYRPDFVQLAKSYGMHAVRVSQQSAFVAALQEAATINSGPMLIECLIEREENVLPIVPPGRPLTEQVEGE